MAHSLGDRVHPPVVQHPLEDKVHLLVVLHPLEDRELIPQVLPEGMVHRLVHFQLVDKERSLEGMVHSPVLQHPLEGRVHLLEGHCLLEDTASLLVDRELIPQVPLGDTARLLEDLGLSLEEQRPLADTASLLVDRELIPRVPLVGKEHPLEDLGLSLEEQHPPADMVPPLEVQVPLVGKERSLEGHHPLADRELSPHAQTPLGSLVGMVPRPPVVPPLVVPLVVGKVPRPLVAHLVVGRERPPGEGGPCGGPPSVVLAWPPAPVSGRPSWGAWV
jgi:hypothetical protein